MSRLRLQSQLLLSTLLILCALTGSILLIIRHTVRSQIAGQVKYGTDASIRNSGTCSGNCSCNSPAPRRSWPKFPP